MSLDENVTELSDSFASFGSLSDSTVLLRTRVQ